MEKKMENYMETGIRRYFILWILGSLFSEPTFPVHIGVLGNHHLRFGV